MDLSTILKMVGVKVAPEHVKAAEDLIPKMPALVNQAVASINGAMQNFDARLVAIETRLGRIENGIIERSNDSDGGDTRSAGIGETQRALESGNLNGQPGGLTGH